MEHKVIAESFLERIYLNEKMVLNCAAYAFRGYSLESENREQTQGEEYKPVKAGFSFLHNLIFLGGEGQSKQLQVTENKSARRYNWRPPDVTDRRTAQA